MEPNTHQVIVSPNNRFWNQNYFSI